MVKSLHRSLEAKLASIKDPEYESDEEMGGDEPETISAKRTGKGAKRKARKNAEARSAGDDDDEPSTVIYLGHLPVAFEEREITVFLNQFGAVKRCRVSRSTKTGRSRGYAFVDFVDPEVARIVAETMSGYFLLEKRLVCHLLPNDRAKHELMFAKPRQILSKADKQKKARAEVNKHRTAEAMKGITAKLVKREEMKRKKLASLGIDYDFPGYAASAQSMEAPKKRRKVSDVDETGGDDVKVEAPKLEKKKKQKKKSKKTEEEAEPIAEPEKENDAANNDVNEAPAAVDEPLKKKKKSSKTPKKKAKTPKK
jgi:nucleolar protein 15